MTSGFGDLAPWGGVGKLSTVNLSGLFMFHGILRAFLTTLFVMISLCLWRTGYAYGDWAALALLPLAIMLFVTHRNLLLAMRLAQRRVIWRPDSFGMRWLSGRLGSTFWALIFVAVTIPLLAWQAVAMRPERLPQLAVAFLLASLLFTALQSPIGRQVAAPFHRNMAINVATMAVLPLVVYAAWQGYHNDPIPARLLNAKLSELPLVALEGLPRRDGWLSQVMAPLQVYDSGKLWLAARFPEQRWLAVLVGLDLALFAFVMGRTGAIVTDFLQMRGIAVRQ